MSHIEEHILELFILGSRKVQGRRVDIEEHLSMCEGCRDLADQMRGFYESAGSEFNRLEPPAPGTTALARVSRPLERLYAPEAPAVPLRRPSRVERAGVFVRQHPVVVGVASFALTALAMLTIVTTSSVKDTNPSRFFFNYEGTSLQVFNKSDELLWERPSVDISATTGASPGPRLYATTQIADLDHDGAAEIVTTLQFYDSDKEYERPVQVFDGRGNLIWRKYLSRPVPHLRRNYDPAFRAWDITVDDFDGDGKDEVIVGGRTYRSPGFTARLGFDGKELGVFWHFGELKILGRPEVDGKKLVLLGGVNDVNDTTRGEFAVIAVVDPSRIIGQTRASACPNLNVPVGDAEIWYVRFPVSDMNAALDFPNSADVAFVRSDGTISVKAVTMDGRGQMDMTFEYVFDRMMNVIEVKSENGTDRFHEKLRQEGKITSTLDRAYLEDLRKGVRYWDGEHWVKEPTRVKHPSNLQLTISN